MFKLQTKVAGLAGGLLVAGAIAGAIATVSSAPRSQARIDSPSLPSASLAQAQTDSSSQWRAMTAEETDAQWEYILQSPLGIAALNQLALEGFINPVCTKQFYTNEQTGGFQALLQVTCPEPRGASTAQGYDEMRVIFNRFESSIENFEVHRVYPDREPDISLPE
ncbi:MAG: hypothetical protein VKK04_14620 [Synechococcales bacterium]|nr:hypothetical protein [Synechococcales bacterium]